MQYQSELSFLRDVFEKSRVHTEILSMDAAASFIGSSDGGRKNFGKIFDSLNRATLYKLKDGLECHYRLLLLPESERREVLIVGPYLADSIGEPDCLEIAEKRKLSQKELRYLYEYYTGLPVVTDDSHLMIMLTSFCERIWKTPSFAVEEIFGEEDFQSAHDCTHRRCDCRRVPHSRARHRTQCRQFRFQLHGALCDAADGLRVGKTAAGRNVHPV